MDEDLYEQCLMLMSIMIRRHGPVTITPKEVCDVRKTHSLEVREDAETGNLTYSLVPTERIRAPKERSFAILDRNWDA